jgi:hypothetical protein
MWVGLWEPDTTDAALLEACAASLERAGARVTRGTDDAGSPYALCRRYEALCPPDDELVLEPGRLSGGPGGLVALILPVDHFDQHPKLKPAKAWARMRRALERLLADVRPLLVACPIELSVEDLPAPPPEAAGLLFVTGWVAPDRLDSGRREAFERALRNGPRAEMAGGWWWSAHPDLDPAGRGAPDAEALSDAVYEAWTGQGAPPVSPAPEALPAGGPWGAAELWFWDAGRDDDQLLADAVAAALTEGLDSASVDLGPNGAPGWFPVVISLDGHQSLSDGLELLRRWIGVLMPTWGALLPESGIAVPGLTPEIPSTGVLPNVWVNGAWTADDLGRRLLATLEGAHREDLAGGTLLVTDPMLVPGAELAEWCHDPEVRWDRLVDAAALLAALARSSRR